MPIINNIHVLSSGGLNKNTLNAKPTDVRSGRTFVGEAGIVETGRLVPYPLSSTISVTPEDVVRGKGSINSKGEIFRGNIDPMSGIFNNPISGDVTVPAGYYPDGIDIKSYSTIEFTFENVPVGSTTFSTAFGNPNGDIISIDSKNENGIIKNITNTSSTSGIGINMAPYIGKGITIIFRNIGGITSMMYNNDPIFTEIPVSGINVYNAKSLASLNTRGGRYPMIQSTTIKTFNLVGSHSITDMNRMFYNCKVLSTIPLLDTSNVTGMDRMFYDCNLLTTIPLLDTSNVTNMSYMFSGCISLTTIPLLDTSNVTNMSYMFSNCKALTTIPLLDNSNVTNMRSMFYKCAIVTGTLDISYAGNTFISDIFTGTVLPITMKYKIANTDAAAYVAPSNVTMIAY